MLSLFPNLFAFPLFAYFILRMVLAYHFFRIARTRLKKPYAFVGVFEIAISVLIFIGLFTQGALIGLMACMVIESLIDRKKDMFDVKEAHIRTILGLVAFALMFLGAGAPAFDLPL